MAKQNEHFILVHGQAEVINDRLVTVLLMKAIDLKSADLLVLTFGGNLKLTALDQFNLGRLERRALKVVN